jgi:hypothetical protein
MRLSQRLRWLEMIKHRKGRAHVHEAATPEEPVWSQGHARRGRRGVAMAWSPDHLREEGSAPTLRLHPSA